MLIVLCPEAAAIIRSSTPARNPGVAFAPRRITMPESATALRSARVRRAAALPSLSVEPIVLEAWMPGECASIVMRRADAGYEAAIDCARQH